MEYGIEEHLKQLKFMEHKFEVFEAIHRFEVFVTCRSICSVNFLHIKAILPSLGHSLPTNRINSRV